MINTKTDWRNRLKRNVGIALFAMSLVFAAIPVALCVFGFYLAGSDETDA